MVDPSRPDGRLENPTVRHERTDASLRGILAVGVASIVLALVIQIVLLWFLYHYADYLARVRGSSFPLAAEQREQLPPGPGSHPLNGGPRAGQRDPLPPEPRLDPINVREGVPAAHVAALYARDAETLQSYGPAPEKGFVRIPIGRAMALLEGKLPAREQPAADRERDQGLLDWGEPNSGRIFREDRR
jgi:hypothetical protein